MREKSNFISLFKDSAIGDKYFITLQKAAEAGVQDFRPVACANIRKPEDEPFLDYSNIAQLSLIEPLDRWGLGGKAYKVNFRCVAFEQEPTMFYFGPCDGQVNESLVCPECQQAYYLSRNGEIYLLPTSTEE